MADLWVFDLVAETLRVTSYVLRIGFCSRSEETSRFTMWGVLSFTTGLLYLSLMLWNNNLLKKALCVTQTIRHINYLQRQLTFAWPSLHTLLFAVSPSGCFVMEASGDQMVRSLANSPVARLKYYKVEVHCCYLQNMFCKAPWASVKKAFYKRTFGAL